LRKVLFTRPLFCCGSVSIKIYLQVINHVYIFPVDTTRKYACLEIITATGRQRKVCTEFILSTGRFSNNLIPLYPNSVWNEVWLNLNAERGQQARFTVYNLSGLPVYQQQRPLSAGPQRIRYPFKT